MCAVKIGEAAEDSFRDLSEDVNTYRAKGS
jgi:hypothetical protein